MKKLCFLILAVVLTVGAKAQTDITIGPKGGFNLTNISNVNDSRNKLSFHVGGFAEFRFTELFALQPELIYSRQGLRMKKDDAGWKSRYRVNYLNIPVMAKFYVYDGLSVDVGPQFGVALNGKVKAKNDGTTVKRKIDDLNHFDMSLGLGVSYKLDMGFVVSARYNFGLTNVISDIGTNKNHVFQLSAGWCFGDLF